MTGTASLEIERRFLVARVADETLRGAGRTLRIRQGYLTEGRPAVRVRQSNADYRMTVKDGEGLVRREIEFDVSGEAAAGLFEIAADRTIEKTRYEVGRWEIDVFRGHFEGLVIAEVELESEDEPLPEIPSGLDLACEVTSVRGFTNQYLASLGEAEARALVVALLRDPLGALGPLDGAEASSGG